MKKHCLKFSGALIERGFWLYIWRVKHKGDCIFYVGRTGDSSSANAASPFNRLSQHLNIKPNATNNTLLKHIKNEGFNPIDCEFDLTSIGPLFPEQDTFEKHKPYRDETAALEAGLAEYLKGKDYKVVGTHPKPKPKNEELFEQVISKLKEQF